MKGDNISMRLRLFAANAVRLCQSFPTGPASKHIIGQLVRAATGGGANYEEARGAVVRLTQDAGLVPSVELEALVREADELVAILTASIKTARRDAAE